MKTTGHLCVAELPHTLNLWTCFAAVLAGLWGADRCAGQEGMDPSALGCRCVHTHACLGMRERMSCARRRACSWRHLIDNALWLLSLFLPSCSCSVSALRCSVSALRSLHSLREPLERKAHTLPPNALHNSSRQPGARHDAVRVGCSSERSDQHKQESHRLGAAVHNTKPVCSM